MGEISKKLIENRRIELAKSIVESAGYKVTLVESEKQSINYHELDTQYPKKKYFKDRYKESGNMQDLIDDLEHQGKHYTIYDDSTDNGCNVFYESSEVGSLDEAVSVGDDLTYEGRPCIVAFIDNDDNEALLKFTDGEDPKKQFVPLSALEPAEPEVEEPEEPAEPEEDYEEKYAGVIEKARDAGDTMDVLQVLFDELVPSKGPADTKAGELVRAMMRLLYRDYNDGDKFYEGYGLETCAAPAAYIAYEWENGEIWDKLADIASSVPNMPEDQGDARYTQALEDIAELVCDRVLEGGDFVKNDGDCLKEDISEIEEMTPKYDWDIEIPYEVMKHIDADHISEDDLEDELNQWELLYDTDFHLESGSIIFNEISKDKREQLEDELLSGLESYGRELDDEYGDPEEEDEDEE